MHPLKYFLAVLATAATIALIAMGLVYWGAEPLMLHLDRAAGGHPVGAIWSPALVRTLSREVGIVAFLGCLGIAIDAGNRRRRRPRW
jgi:hypothetical protein